MNREKVLALWLLHRRRKKQKRNRLFWVHPSNQLRHELGLFYTSFEDLRNDENKFFNYFRMSVASFDELHGKIKDVLQRQDTPLRRCLKSVEMLAITLRYLASGCTFTDLHRSFRIGTSTATKIVEEVCRAIWLLMREEFIPTPTPVLWESIISGFETTVNFPNCLGAVGGKYIRLTRPSKYDNDFSVVLIAVADTQNRFVYIDVGNYDSNCDTSIFKQSSLWQSIQKDIQQLPEEKCLPGMESPKLPFYFVGDESFGLHKHLLRPFSSKCLPDDKRIFNYQLYKAQRFVECAFGILTNKWHVFHRPINVRPDFAVLIVSACMVLHNFVRDRDGIVVEDTTSVIGLQDLPPEDAVRGGYSANNVRNLLCKHFQSNNGNVPWLKCNI